MRALPKPSLLYPLLNSEALTQSWHQGRFLIYVPRKALGLASIAKTAVVCFAANALCYSRLIAEALNSKLSFKKDFRE